MIDACKLAVGQNAQGATSKHSCRGCLPSWMLHTWLVWHHAACGDAWHAPQSPSAQPQPIMSSCCTCCTRDPMLTPSGIICCPSVQVTGESFMLHHIRHMIGGAAAVARGIMPAELLPASLTAPVRVTIPRAPPHSLLLGDAFFSDFRKVGAWAGQGPELVLLMLRWQTAASAGACTFCSDGHRLCSALPSLQGWLLQAVSGWMLDAVLRSGCCRRWHPPATMTFSASQVSVLSIPRPLCNPLCRSRERSSWPSS